MVKINLLPIRQMLRTRELKQFATLAVAILLITILAMTGTYWWLSTKVSSLQAEQRQQQSKLNQLKRKNKEINKLKAEIARLQRQVDTIKKLTRIRNTPAPFMAALSIAIPDEVWLSSISKTGKRFSLVGKGVDNTVVVNFVHRLQKIKQGFTLKHPWLDSADKNEKSFFSRVKLVQIVRKGATMSFTIVGRQR
ncbi:MAG: PilN domain-containing protein [Deltaproteobacteria bacterium]